MSIQKQMLEELQAMDEESYFKFMCAAYLKAKSPGIKRKFINFCGLQKGPKETGSGVEGTPPPRPEIFRSETIPAWQIPLIYRGDIVPKDGLLFIDVEKVSQRSTHRNVAATVAVVDQKKDIILWAIIQHSSVCQYFPKLTGLTEDKIEKGIPPEHVRLLLEKLLTNNTIVAAAIDEDLRSLDVKPSSSGFKSVDIQYFFRDDLGPIKLLDVANHLFPQKSDFQCSLHSAISDSRMTQKIYKRMIKLQNEGQTVYPGKIPRSKREKKLNVGDRCTCDKTRKKYKKNSRPQITINDLS